MTAFKRIGIDLDGVIIDHTPAKLHLAAGFGFVLEPWQTNTNLMKGFMPIERYRALQESLYGEMTLRAPAVSGAKESLTAAMDSGFEPHLISRRSAASVPFARDWLASHGFSGIFSEDRIHFCPSDAEKAVVCGHLSIASFVDDKLSVLMGLPPVARRILLVPDGAAGRLVPSSEITVAPDWPSCLAAILVSA